MGKHRRLKPDCPFITNPTGSGNVAMNNVQPSTSEVPTNDLMNEQCRLATYANWPVSIAYFHVLFVLRFLCYFLFLQSNEK